MNIHHLELFYYVARHGGISEAVRNIPYGIQQPAVSGQVAQLEEFLGVKLFQRRPFALTPPGEKLYNFIQPFFSGLDAVALELQGGEARQIRLGASAVVLREHMPEFLKSIRRKFPQARLTLREGIPAVLDKLLQQEELDLAVSILDKTSAPGTRCEELLRVPLALLVKRDSPIKKPEDLWKQDKIHEALVALPPTEHITRHFQQGLARIGVDWFTSIEVNSLDLIETYVANGFGVGISADVPRRLHPDAVRCLPLNESEFEPLSVGLIWRGKVSPLLRAFMDEIKASVPRTATRAASRTL
jgi:DNA-binding transcriptional LysR family regulator